MTKLGPDAYTTCAERLRLLRRSARLSQIYVAIELGVSQATISSYECGLTHPSIEHLVLLSQIYEVSTDYLLGLTDVSKMQPLSAYSNRDQEEIKKYLALPDHKKALIRDLIHHL